MGVDYSKRGRLLVGHVLDKLAEIPSDSVHCCVTSPPYWGLRDYGVEGQLGLEKMPQEFIANMTEVFEEVRRVLRPDGTCWVNIGDSYASNWPCNRRNQVGSGSLPNGKREARPPRLGPNIKDKDLCLIPFRLAIALQEAGWYVRSDIIWAKPNPMPESVRDRPTKAHEYLFLLTKSAKYFYDADAISEPVSPNTHARLSQNVAEQIGSARANGGAKTNGNMNAVGKVTEAGSGVKNNESFVNAVCLQVERRNARTVWEITTQGYPEAHFATFPEELPRRCILAGCPEGGTVLDPFLGSGTTAAVAVQLGRDWIGIELNPAYAELAMKRITAETPSLFSGMVAS